MLSRFALAILLRLFTSGETGSGVIVVHGRRSDHISDGRERTRGACSDFGQSMQICTENCTNTHTDGRSGTCSMTIDLEVCTCRGRNSIVREMKKYEMENGEEIPEGSEAAEQGYIGMCGTCVKFCRIWPGEAKVSHNFDEISHIFMFNQMYFQ